MQEAAPIPHNPPLTRWAEGWRLLLCLAISGLVWGQVAEPEWEQERWLFWLDLGLGLASFPLVHQRRRWPFPVAVALNVVQMVSGFASGPGALAMVSLATRRRIPQLVVVGVVAVVCGQLYFYIAPTFSPDPPWVNFTFALVFTVAVIAVGMYLGSRRELLWSLRERAQEAEREQELRMDRARSLERERIAREMHDVLAHRISLITMHAGALAYRPDLPTRQVTETAELISTTAHEALTDLREVLGSLRQGDEEHNRPQPRLVDVRALVEEARASGAAVELHSDLAEAHMPDRIGRTVYRIVQEALTNARKHAPGARVHVTVAGRPGDGIRVRVRNELVGRDGDAPGAGLGLVGMRERVDLAGGRLQVEREPDSFSLSGWLPWPR